MSKLLIKHAFLVIWEKLHACPYTRDFVAAAFANVLILLKQLVQNITIIQKNLGKQHKSISI